MPKGWDMGRQVAQGVKSYFFYEHGHVAYQTDGDDN